MNNPLRSLITAQLTASGFMTLYDYMHLALYHPQHGYYQKEAVIGRAGDFITAPEISQIFGELLGLWCAHQAQAQGLINKAILVELGAGRGTLMADALRAWNTLNLPLPQLHIIETSPHLKTQQKTNLAHFPALKIHWHESPKTLPEKPLLMVANEFFDALPIQQYRRKNNTWQQRGISLDSEKNWQLTWRKAKKTPLFNSPAFTALPEKQIFTHAPDYAAFLTPIAQRIAQHGGAGIIIDYGKMDGYGDSLQAVKNHQAVKILAHTGTADLTSWVDFAHLKNIAETCGCITEPPIPQGQFLRALGITTRTEQLAQGKPAKTRRALLAAIDRLVNPAQMGQVFKVMTIAPKE